MNKKQDFGWLNTWDADIEHDPRRDNSAFGNDPYDPMAWNTLFE